MNGLDKSEIAKHRNKYSNNKEKLILEWEKNTGQKWPTYEKEVIKNGKSEIKPYQYDGHHINPVSHGGPNKWWNLHPALPKEHGVMHGGSSQFKEIFNKIAENVK